MSITKLGALRIANPPAWAKQIRQAMKRAGGSIGDAAKELDVGRRTLNLWLSDAQFDDVERIGAGRPAKDPK